MKNTTDHNSITDHNSTVNHNSTTDHNSITDHNSTVNYNSTAARSFHQHQSQKSLLERPRRLRQSPAIRRAVRETRLNVSSLIYPVFVRYGQGIREEIPSMPGVYRYSVDMLRPAIEEMLLVGVEQVLLFGIIEDTAKDSVGSSAWDDRAPVQQAIRLIKSIAPELIVWADICLCEYTDHGHCGLLCHNDICDRTEIDNDSTLDCLARAALSCAAAGADGVAPSDMMDGRIGWLRQSLDQAGYTDRLIMAYSAKFASAFYGPFRDAAGSAPSFGDRRSYQMDPANGREAIRELRLDLEEGADIVMVKPAVPYQDIIRQAADISDRPVAAYHVSGEYSMIKAAAQNGWIDEKRVVLESLLASQRAGASMLITYHALNVARWLVQQPDL
jgi:porphobilinogen synthase